MVSAVSGTNIDVNTLVSQLMQAERAPLAAILRAQTGFQSKISAYGKMQSALSTLGDAAKKLDLPATFRAASARVSDATVLGASASAGATAGTYSIEVQALAQSQKLSSAAFAAADSVVGTGSLRIQMGTYASGPNTFTANPNKGAQDITIDASNNTLAGVRDAINNAAGEVRASIINDGSGFRLALTAIEGGVANSLKITAVDGDGTNTNASGLSQLAYDPAVAIGSGKNLTQNQAAQDALLYIDGVRVVKSSNTVSDAIEGLTLNLAKVNTGSTVSVTVAADAEAMKSALDGFVKAYNGFNTTARQLTFYDAGNRSAGALQGDATARAMQASVRGILASVAGGVSGGLTRLSQVGLTLQSDGALAFDSARFQKAVDSNSADLAALFTTTGKSSDTRVQFINASAVVAAGSYAVNLTQAASRGRLTGDGAAGLGISAGVNDALSLTIDGQAVSITLSAGTYASADALAAEIQSKINGDSGLKALGISTTASQSGGVLSLTSAAYGAASVVTAAGGSAAANLFGAAPATTPGTDVAGTINGLAAIGGGQNLTSTDGLRLKVAAQASGALGSVSVSRGYASLLSAAVGALIDSGGPINTRTEGLNASIKRNNAQQVAFNARMTTLEANYRRQFSALDTMLGSMNTTSNFLTQQLAQYNNNRS